MIVTSEPLDEVRHLHVTADNPVSSTSEHLDFERCAALHSAIVKHAWVARGRDLADLDLTKRVWPLANAGLLQEAQERLHPDLIAFLERALEGGDGDDYSHFFLFMTGLANGQSWWDFTEDDDGDCITLYHSNDDSSPRGIAIVYDQEDHLCKFDGEWHLIMGVPQEWQPLEMMLTVWLILIERGKVVALHDTLPATGNNRYPEDSISFEDEATGARRGPVVMDPWTTVSFAKQDLLDTLDAWHALVETINQKSPDPKTDAFVGRSLFSRDVLRAAGIKKKSLAWEFFTSARKPAIDWMGPGLRLVTEEELINNPFKNESHGGGKDSPHWRFPVPILLGTGLADNWFHVYGNRRQRVSPEEITWGLYLDGSFADVLGSVEDGCRLVLPFSFGENGFVHRADGSVLKTKHDLHGGGRRADLELFQIGQDPFGPSGPTQLFLVFEAFARNVAEGIWKVGAHGVDEPDTKFKDADTEEWGWHYVVEGLHGTDWTQA